MCGIAGYVGNVDRKYLYDAIKNIEYRGPDGSGFYFAENVGLGHRRLSIIDCVGGDQPIFNEDKTIAIVFNGEIYNFQVLKEKLLKSGHKFYTNTDTEVIIHLYEEMGEKVFEDLNGMFALAIWDTKKEKLLLGRDRFGQKPLYWYFKDGLFLFGSELKTILSFPEVSREIGQLALQQYFYFDYVPQPQTIFKDILKLENGHYLVWQGSKVQIDKYFNLSLVASPQKKEQSLLGNLDTLLSGAVHSHLVSDVPIGIFLSGGLDSSTVAYYAKQIDSSIKTFSIGFEEDSYDESKFANLVAEHLQTKHYSKVFSAKEMLNILPQVIKQLDEPFGDPSLLPTFLLAQFTREHVTVALGGDGADELLLGYPNHLWQKINYYITFLQNPIHLDWLRQLISGLPVSDRNLTFGYKMIKLMDSLPFFGLQRDQLMIGGFDFRLPQLFKNNDNSKHIFDFSSQFLKEHSDCNYLDLATLQFQKYYLSDDILFKVDRAGMYNSLEVRAPFLDQYLSDFLNRLPAEQKLYFCKSKYILKKLMKDKLPRAVIDRRKKGFGIPLASWLRGELKPYLEDLLSSVVCKNLDIFNYQLIHTFVHEHLDKKADHGKILWKLIIFNEWAKNYLK